MLSRNSFTVYGGSFVEVVEAPDVAGLEADAAPVPLEERNLPAARDGLEEARFLPRANLVARNAEHLAEVVRRRRKFARERFVVERAEQPGNVAFVGHGSTRNGDIVHRSTRRVALCTTVVRGACTAAHERRRAVGGMNAQ